MSTITTRSGKGSALTHAEVDDNFTNLNTDKVETSAIGTTVQAYDSNLTSFVSTFTLPTSDGSSGQVLQTNGSGTLSFAAAASGSPSGSVMYFAMSTAPTGWLKANGAAISRSTYSDLFSAIGTTFGSGDGSTTFNVPDLRGEFLRAWDDSRGVDTSRVFGSAQSAANQEHGHYVGTGAFTSAGSGYSGTTTAGDAYRKINAEISYYRYGGANTLVYPTNSDALKAQNDGSEGRPRNIALLACIKF